VKKTFPQNEKALKAARRLLRLRPRSVWELATRLRKTFSEATCQNVIQELQQKNLLNDADFAAFWIENRLQFKPKGRQVLFQELRQKGVEGRVIEGVLNEAFPKDERKVAEALLHSRRRLLKRNDPKSTQKMYRYLRNRGFQHELIAELLKEEINEEVDR